MTEYEIKIEIKENEIFSRSIEGTIIINSALARKEVGNVIVDRIKKTFK